MAELLQEFVTVGDRLLRHLAPGVREEQSRSGVKCDRCVAPPSSGRGATRLERGNGRRAGGCGGRWRPVGLPQAGRTPPRPSDSSGGGGECVEIAAAADGIYIRDSKVRSGPVLTVTPQAWARLVRLAADQTI
ncbi:DUF397 domain-containing protein [Streptomyces sp. NBC_01707]|uniref:DUF397 domain-containing protein n=1 Tax=Streptomyces sp. NBC_01707 TaxID=2975914 RepID=UPI00352DF4CC